MKTRPQHSISTAGGHVRQMSHIVFHLRRRSVTQRNMDDHSLSPGTETFSTRVSGAATASPSLGPPNLQTGSSVELYDNHTRFHSFSFLWFILTDTVFVFPVGRGIPQGERQLPMGTRPIWITKQNQRCGWVWKQDTMTHPGAFGVKFGTAIGFQKNKTKQNRKIKISYILIPNKWQEEDFSISCYGTNWCLGLEDNKWWKQSWLDTTIQSKDDHNILL